MLRPIHWPILAWSRPPPPASLRCQPRKEPPAISIRRRWLLWLGLAALLALAASLLLRSEPAQTQRDHTGLFTTLPILWNESTELADLLKPQQDEHWAKALIAAGGAVVPLDALASADGTSALTGLRYLVLAQPRPLSPQENVALDAWVRGGGMLLLLADPMLTEDTIFALGDKRRPHDVVQLAPILNRWGLELLWDEEMEFIEGPVFAMGIEIETNMPGEWKVLDSARCRASGDGLAAMCQIGKGRVLAVSDAAVIERDDAAGTRAKALKSLLDAAFGGAGR